MSKQQTTLRALTTLIILSAPYSSYATNGMNLEGYGPIAMAMGGASMAYDNGTAAVINNPATLGLAADGRHADIALGKLGPDISASIVGSPVAAANSSGDAYYMPALGWLTKQDGIAYGIGVFAQGGMGTEYGPNTWMADPSQGANTLNPQLDNRSEVSIGRLMAPVTFEVNKKLIIGGTVDLVWAGMDLQMAMSEAQFADMANPSAQTIGTASGTLVSGFGTMYEPFGGTGIATLHHAYFDFSNNSNYTGEASSTGFAGKLGVVYKVNPQLTLGATYHSKTRLKDMSTSNATLSMAVNADFGSGYQDYNIPVTGKITVKDFQWPETIGFGIAYQATNKLRVVADTKHINWSDVMQSFKMQFKADSTQANPIAVGFAGATMDAAIYQEWKDQTTVQLGLDYAYNKKVNFRTGINFADNPVPDTYVNALFPATIEKHYTGGIGYAINAHQAVNFSYSYAPKIKTTNPGNGSTIPAIATSHSQQNWQLMYSHQY